MVISRVVSRVALLTAFLGVLIAFLITILATLLGVLIALLRTTHEPASTVALELLLMPRTQWSGRLDAGIGRHDDAGSLLVLIAPTRSMCGLKANRI